MESTEGSGDRIMDDRARILNEIVAGVNREAQLVRSLRESLVRQRGAVARDDTETVQATIDRNVKTSPLAQVAGTIGAIVSGHRADRARRR